MRLVLPETLKLVVFDLAGTTVQDNGEVPESFVAALKKHGLTVTEEQLNTVRGSSKREAVLQLMPDSKDKRERAAEVYRSFRKLLTERYLDGVAPIEGAEELFGKLCAEQVKVILNTGFDREVTNVLLEALKWKSKVDAVICGDDVEHGRPAPDLIFAGMRAGGVKDPNQVANVGDTILDLMAASNAGVKWNIGVLSGAHSRAKLEQVPHTQLVDSVADLQDFWSA